MSLRRSRVTSVEHGSRCKMISDCVRAILGTLSWPRRQGQRCRSSCLRAGPLVRPRCNLPYLQGAPCCSLPQHRGRQAPRCPDRSSIQCDRRPRAECAIWFSGGRLQLPTFSQGEREIRWTLAAVTRTACHFNL